MIRPPFPEVLDALIEVGRPILRERFHARCCIAATRLTVTVLNECGYPADPKACWARAGNAAFVDDVTYDRDPATADRRGVRIVEIGAGPDNEGFGAHLVAVSSGTLIDLSAEQFDRPAKGIVVPDWIMLDLPDDWQTAPVGQSLDKGGIIVYRFLAVAPDHRLSPNWAPADTREAAQATLASLGKVLA